MIQSLRRSSRIYSAMAELMPKLFMTYRAWFWIGMVLNIIALTIFIYFWRAVYANTDDIAGMHLQQTLTYILLARLFIPLIDMFVIWEFGYHLREGGIAIALLRPLDLQASYYVQALSNTVMFLLWQVPLALLASLIFGIQWPTDPAVWGAFLVSAFLGRTVMFFFDWILSCLTFYTTEVWGLGVLLEGLSAFLSGSLIPLVMMPDWLQTVARSFPFAQGLYNPLAILTGIVPLEQAPQVWLTQLAWVAALLVLSRLIFRLAVRKVTVQGG